MASGNGNASDQGVIRTPFNFKNGWRCTCRGQYSSSKFCRLKLCTKFSELWWRGRDVSIDVIQTGTPISTITTDTKIVIRIHWHPSRRAQTRQSILKTDIQRMMELQQATSGRTTRGGPKHRPTL
ncbi:hypothetical protein PAXINDRAFT_156670 [Paxillus involutus ATCC 200175]|uniref:Uncharacterized protein n=1 Tax=Paxillus involutus ATCC 200175 TaxID=664439 RepID=A0A0C9U0U3_PAXIN|nr:hypothetical protein PAXINDRAFT_156670 [Paxillus involutus ATCC 200175]